MPNSEATLTYDPSDPAMVRDPYPVVKALREEEPVHFSEPLAAWLITSHEFVDELLTRAENVSANRIGPFVKRLKEPDRSSAAEVMRWLDNWLVFVDAPKHTRLRRHIGREINPRLADVQAAAVADVTNSLLEQLPRDRVFDFHEEFAMRLPGFVVMDMIGVPRERIPDILDWSEEIMAFLGTARGVPNKYERARGSAHAMGEFFRALVEQRKVDPRDDLISKLLASEIAGDELTDDEIIATLMVLGNAAQGTTAHLITNSIIALTQNPEIDADLRENLGSIDVALEEFLRYDSPVLSAGRILVGDVEIGGKVMRDGDRVFAMIVGANRDPAVFDDPDSLHIRRDPNRHLTFSKGAHFCLGAPLARLEGREALRGLLERFERIEIAEELERIPWTNSMTARGPVRLPVRLR